MAAAVALSVITSTAGVVTWITYDNIRITQRHLSRFTRLPQLGTFKETLPFAYATARVDHAVLLLHGYSAGTSEFKHLAPELRRAEIPHYAPEITGFGLGHLLHLGREQHFMPQMVGVILVVIIGGWTLAVAAFEHRNRRIIVGFVLIVLQF